MRGADLRYPAIIVGCALLIFCHQRDSADGASPRSAPSAGAEASLFTSSAGSDVQPQSAGEAQKSEDPGVNSAQAQGDSNSDEKSTEERAAELRERWGIETLGIQLSAGGYMLDFRFRVLEPEKAGALFDHKNKPCLIDQKSGAKFAVPTPPKVGALRTSRTPKAGTISFMMFANPGGYVKAGNLVTIEVGEFKVTDLTVK